MSSDRDSDEINDEIDQKHIAVYRDQHKSKKLIAKYAILALFLNVSGLVVIYFLLSKQSAGPHGPDTLFFPARKSIVLGFCCSSHLLMKISGVRNQNIPRREFAVETESCGGSSMGSRITTRKWVYHN